MTDSTDDTEAAMSKYLSALHDAMRRSDYEHFHQYFEKTGISSTVRDQVANIDIGELQWGAYWDQLEAIMEDKDRFIELAMERGYEMYYHEDAIAGVEEELDRAVNAGLVKTREEAEQKYGDAIRNLYPAMSEEETREAKAKAEELKRKRREEIERAKTEAKERLKREYREAL